MKYKDGSKYSVIVRDESGKLLKNVGVKFSINSKSYTYKTNSKGIASIPLYLNVGSHTIKAVVDDDYYQSSVKSNNIFVNGVKLVYNNPTYVSVGKSASFLVKAVDGKNNPIKNKIVTFKLDGKKPIPLKLVQLVMLKLIWVCCLRESTLSNSHSNQLLEQQR